MDFKKLVDKYQGTDEIFLIYNESYYSYEYDTDIRYAFIFLNKTNNALRLVIFSEYTKTGIGAGVTYKLLYDNYVGVLSSPKLNTIISECKKNSHIRSRFGFPFKKVWYKEYTNETTGLSEYFKEMLKNSTTNIKTALQNKNEVRFEKNILELEKNINITFKTIYTELMDSHKDIKPYLLKVKAIKTNIEDLKNILKKLNES